LLLRRAGFRKVLLQYLTFVVFTLLDHLLFNETPSRSENTGKLIAKAIVQVRGSEIQTLTDTELFFV
jgi:hypothetical protein